VQNGTGLAQDTEFEFFTQVQLAIAPAVKTAFWTLP
jgi:hypothetical protein